MQFFSTINNTESYEINYGLDRHGDVVLDRVEVYSMDGDPIEPDFFTEDEWETIRQLCETDYLAEMIDRAAELRWD